MTSCPQCSAEVQQGWKACPACGERLPEVSSCVSCGAELQQDWKACPACGNKVDSGQGASLTIDDSTVQEVHQSQTDDMWMAFPDKVLEASVRMELEKPEGPILRGDLKRLDHIDWGGAKIEDLTGLEYAVNLETLRLTIEISDISPLASLTNLTELELVDNQITDISPLASLTNLTHLALADNQISDVSPLASLTNLTELYLQNNPVKTGLFGRDVHVKTLMSRGVKVKG